MKKNRNQLSSSGSPGGAKDSTSAPHASRGKRLSGGSSNSATKGSPTPVGRPRTSHETKEKLRVVALARISRGEWCAKKLWTPTEDAALGTAPDGELGALLGRPRGSVVARRHKLGIPAFRSPGRSKGQCLPWAEHKKGKRKPKL